jgi:Zn-dependent alcohol dehydrogenase
MTTASQFAHRAVIHADSIAQITSPAELAAAAALARKGSAGLAAAVEILLRTGHTFFNACILATSFARAA